MATICTDIRYTEALECKLLYNETWKIDQRLTSKLLQHCILCIIAGGHYFVETG